MSSVPISITTTNGSSAVSGRATGTPAIQIPNQVKAGVLGTSDDGIGVCGRSSTGPAVMGESLSAMADPTGIFRPGPSDGVFGSSGKNGVHGKSISQSDSGVWGENAGGGYGISGSTNSSFQPGIAVIAAVWGNNAGSGAGVKGSSHSGDGVVGFGGAGHAGVSAVNDSGGTTSYGVWARGTPAGHFEGNVEVTGDITLLNRDCAEDFEMSGAGEVDPGSVVVIESGGTLKPSDRAYDKCVVGVVSGAADCKPGVILGRQLLQKNRRPVALVGTVYCKVDASYAPVDVGDLLTTSATPGHAMKAVDHIKAFGAVFGKALGSLPSGRGLVPVLVALQ